MEKIKFTDIVGMLERDEMREITGGCGQTYGSAGGWGGGGGGSSFGSIMGMGFGGGASYGGSSSGSSSSSSASSYSSANYSSNNYSSGWSNTAGGFTTNDPNAISRYLDFVYANKGVVTYAQTSAFINNEATVAGQVINNVAYSIQLNPVTVVNNYHGPSTIPQGIVINNGVVSSNGVILNTSGTPNTSSGVQSNQQIGSHSLPMTNLPVGDGTDKQIPNLCVFRNMEVVEKYFKSKDTQGIFVVNYIKTYQHTAADVLLKGFEGKVSDLTNFIGANFNKTACTTEASMISAINSNQPILAFLTNSTLPDGTIDGHEVTIVEYKQETNQFRYYDSIKDKYLWGASTSFSNCQAVSGSK